MSYVCPMCFVCYRCFMCILHSKYNWYIREEQGVHRYASWQLARRELKWDLLVCTLTG